MEVIQLIDKAFEKYLDKSQIQYRVSELGMQLSRVFEGEQVLFVVVLNGAAFFAVDVLKSFRGDSELSFVKFASYAGTRSTGAVSELIGLEADVKGRKVVILEDILDTGRTIEVVVDLLKNEGAEQVQVCTLLYKPSQNESSITPDWVGFEISKEFVVGYGLDYNGKGRHYPSIYKLKET